MAQKPAWQSRHGGALISTDAARRRQQLWLWAASTRSALLRGEARCAQAARSPSAAPRARVRPLQEAGHGPCSPPGAGGACWAAAHPGGPGPRSPRRGRGSFFALTLSYRRQKRLAVRHTSHTPCCRATFASSAQICTLRRKTQVGAVSAPRPARTPRYSRVRGQRASARRQASAHSRAPEAALGRGGPDPEGRTALSVRFSGPGQREGSHAPHPCAD